MDCEAELETDVGQANLPPEVTSSILTLIRAYKAEFLADATVLAMRWPDSKASSPMIMVASAIIQMDFRRM